MNRLAASILVLAVVLTGAAAAATGPAPGDAAKAAPAANPEGKQPGGTIMIQPSPVSLPAVQLFATQPATFLRLGAPNCKQVPVHGEVYGRVPFIFGSTGNITLVPNGPTATACPVFVIGVDRNGFNPVNNQPISSLPPNTEFFVTVCLQAMPGMAPGSSGLCTLKYTAVDETSAGDYMVGSNNQVTVPYTIKPAS